MQRRGIRSRIPRSDQTDAALEVFQRRYEVAVQGLEDYKKRIEQNASLSLNDRRELVFRTLVELDSGNGGQHIWFFQIQWRAGLTEPQVYDALEHWMLERVTVNRTLIAVQKGPLGVFGSAQ